MKPKPYSTGSSYVTVLDDGRDFAALEGEWEELYRNSPAATPFQSWAWLYSWWEFYGGPYELRLVALRDAEGGLLVGLIPLMLERRRRGGGGGRLLFVGTGPTDYLDALVREGWEAEVCEAGARAIGGMGSWRVADLQQVRPEAAAWGIFRSWAGPRTHVWQDGCPVVEVKPRDALFMALSRNHRKIARRTLRRAEEDGVRCELVGPDDAEQAARRLVALHREMWRGRDIIPEHLTRSFEAHLEAAVHRMTVSGTGAISELRQSSGAIVSTFLLFGQDFVGTYMAASSQEALRRYSFSSLYILDAVNVARNRNLARVDLLRGEEPYKLRWDPKVIPNRRVILGRNRLTWGPYAGYCSLRSRLKRYTYSEQAPQWVKDARTRYRVLRYGVARYVNSEEAPRWIKRATANWFKAV